MRQLYVRFIHFDGGTLKGPLLLYCFLTPIVDQQRHGRTVHLIYVFKLAKTLEFVLIIAQIRVVVFTQKEMGV